MLVIIEHYVLWAGAMMEIHWRAQSLCDVRAVSPDGGLGRFCVFGSECSHLGYIWASEEADARLVKKTWLIAYFGILGRGSSSKITFYLVLKDQFSQLFRLDWVIEASEFRRVYEAIKFGCFRRRSGGSPYGGHRWGDPFTSRPLWATRRRCEACPWGTR